MKLNQSESQSEEKLVDALRCLARESSRVASPDVEAGLAAAFRRHHRHRRTGNAALAILAMGCLVSVALLLARPQKSTSPIAQKTPSPAAVSLKQPATAAVVSSNSQTKKIPQRDARVRVRPRPRIQTEARQSAAFLPLPSYDPVFAKDDLQIIRVEMPIQDLRLVGAPVGADVPNRQVRADFVVGHDGTPYAVRLVQ